MTNKCKHSTGELMGAVGNISYYVCTECDQVFAVIEDHDNGTYQRYDIVLVERETEPAAEPKQAALWGE